MKKTICLLLLAFMAVLWLSACGETAADYDFRALSDAMEKAQALRACRLETVTEVDILQGTRTELTATRQADITYLLDQEGDIEQLQGSFSILDGNDKNEFSVYCANGMAYFDEENRKHAAAVSPDAFEVRELFLFFQEKEIEDYRAVRDGDGRVKITFFVPWESVSEKANDLCDQLSEVLQASGTAYTWENLTYRDIRAEFVVDTKSNTLVSYSYTYEANVTISDTAVKVTGTSTCRLLETENVQLTPPDLTLWD